MFKPEPLAVQSASRTHVGLVRPINEDRVFDCPARGLWAVADGMGGHSGGDLAAQAVIDALRAQVDGDAPIDQAAMLAAIHTANAAIVRDNRSRSTDAGSTVVAAQITDRTATIAWVGDSRAYLIRDRTVRQISRDHSFVQDLIDAGLLTVAAAANHPRANVVTRALGIAEHVDIATVTIELERGDRLLLCSDGLSRSLETDAMRQRVDLDRLVGLLMADALRRDGSDNISLVCVAID